IETDRIERNSRHLYDLHMIWNKFKDDLCSDKEKFKELFDSVVLERSQKPTIKISAQHGYQIKNKLSEIIFHHPYINDYKEITVGLMYKDADVIPYESTIVSLNEIMESGLFPEVIELQIAEV
ncbi:hypothetical protein CN630_32490, partial [Bacillus wiedmannii]|uniref:hypothetical protein n=1 Tax=Bacillus wiedmannii TaxID=1890302 RepID=UPI000BFAFF46